MLLVEAFQSYLEQEGIIGGSSGWASVRRKMHDGDNDQMVVVAEDGGRPPEIGTTEGLGNAAIKDVGVHFTVRASKGDGDSSAEKAQEIFDALHGQLRLDLASGVSTLRIAAMTSGPVFAGFDERGRPLHTLAVRAAQLVTTS